MKREKNFIWEKFTVNRGSFLLSLEAERISWIHVLNPIVFPVRDVCDSHRIVFDLDRMQSDSAFRKEYGKRRFDPFA
ncbi:hypothetical protein EHQ05_02700 [Leptospira yasudae]|nr:hypothetical protein EHQ05_02700 [Leptospira yasudae]TGM07484.1 hypothetical protein EHQ86_05315 [Leptospira yasudae]TGN01254.1 hypothetical protein EHR10_06365 [Leptospira yasudae]